MNPGKRSGPARILRSPVLWIVAGGILGSFFVKSYFHPAYAELGLVVALVVLGFGVLVLMGGSLPDEVGVLMIGLGVFLVLAGLGSFRERLKHQQVNNRRLHLVGTLDPPHDLTVRRVNSEKASFRFFLLDPPGELQTRFVGSSARELRMTGQVEWYSLGESFREYLREHGYHGALSGLTIHEVGDPRKGEKGLVALRGGITQWLRDHVGQAPYSTSMLQALLTGDRHFPTHLEMLLRRLGMVHLFVISGFHVGLIFLLLRGVTSSIPRTAQVMFTGMVLLGYLWFLGWPISATRAGVMLVLGTLATLLNHRTTLIDILLATVLLLMLLDPFVVFDVGFQLSVAAVAGIQLVYPTLKSVDGSFLRSYFWISAGAYVGTLPVILHHYQYVAPLAFPGSVLAGFLFPAFLGLLSIQGLCLALEWTFLVQWIESVLARGIGGLLGLVESTGWVWGTPESSLWVTFLLAACLTVVLPAFLSKTVRVLGGAVSLCIILVLTGAPQPGFVELWSVRNTPVSIFRTENGRTGLIVAPGERLNEYRVRRVSRRLKNRGIHHLDYLISAYSRRLFRQFGADFTVGAFVNYGQRARRVRWEGGHFDVHNLQLKSGDTIISFETTRVTGTLKGGSGAIVATTSDGRCLVDDTDRMDPKTFDRLQSLDCELTFLREGPVVYAADGRVHRSYKASNETVTSSNVLRTLLRIR